MAKRWTEEELTLLEDKWGIWSVNRLAKELQRTEAAIIVKAERLKLGGAYNSYLTTSEVGALFGVHRRTVLHYWINKYGLKAKANKLRSQKIYRVTIDDLITWAKENQDKWDSRNLDEYALGKEFDWLVEKRKQDAKNTIVTGDWSLKDYKTLIDLSEQGVSLKDIAQQLNRTYFAVRRKRQQYLDTKKEAVN